MAAWSGKRVGISNIPSSSSASGVWSVNEQLIANKSGAWPVSVYPPPVSNGLFAWHKAEDFQNSTWPDSSGNNRSASVASGTVSKISTTGNGASKTFTTLQGNTSSKMNFANDVLPPTYTLFHVARYNAGTRQRIFDGGGGINWLSGFWGGASGVAFHNGWLTPTNSVHGDNWVLSTDQNSLYRSNGVTRGSSGGSASAPLTIMNGAHPNETSDWMVAEILVYNRTLSSTEYQEIEAWLSNKYGIALG